MVRISRETFKVDESRAAEVPVHSSTEESQARYEASHCPATRTVIKQSRKQYFAMRGHRVRVSFVIKLSTLKIVERLGNQSP